MSDPPRTLIASFDGGGMIAQVLPEDDEGACHWVALLADQFVGRSDIHWFVRPGGLRG